MNDFLAHVVVTMILYGAFYVLSRTRPRWASVLIMTLIVVVGKEVADIVQDGWNPEATLSDLFADGLGLVGAMLVLNLRRK